MVGTATGDTSYSNGIRFSCFISNLFSKFAKPNQKQMTNIEELNQNTWR